MQTIDAVHHDGANVVVVVAVAVAAVVGEHRRRTFDR